MNKGLDKQDYGHIASILSQYKVYFHPHKPYSVVIVSSSLISSKSAFLHDGYRAAIENCCAPMVVKRTLFTTCIVSLLLGASFNTILAMHITFSLGPSFNTKL